MIATTAVRARTPADLRAIASRAAAELRALPLDTPRLGESLALLAHTIEEIEGERARRTVAEARRLADRFREETRP